MPTNLGIDEELLKAALRAGGHRTKRDTVNEALRASQAIGLESELLTVDPDFEYLAELSDLKVLFLGTPRES